MTAPLLSRQTVAEWLAALGMRFRQIRDAPKKHGAFGAGHKLLASNSGHDQVNAVITQSPKKAELAAPRLAAPSFLRAFVGIFAWTIRTTGICLTPSARPGRRGRRDPEDPGMFARIEIIL
jgi:hypothetical protein